MTSYAKIDTWNDPSGTATRNNIVQVKQFVADYVWSQASASGGLEWYTVPGFQCTMKLRQPNSKIMVMMDLHLGTTYWEIQGRLTRNGNEIALGNERSYRAPATFIINAYNYNGANTYSQYDWYTHSFQYLDTPQVTNSTNNTYTYGLKLNAYSNNTMYFNRPGYTNFDSDYWTAPISTITLLEISQ